MAPTKNSTLWLYRDYDYHLVRWHGRNPPRSCSDLALDGERVDDFCADMFEALTDIQFPEDAMRRVERIEFRWAKPEPKKRPTAKNRPKAKASRR